MMKSETHPADANITTNKTLFVFVRRQETLKKDEPNVEQQTLGVH